MPFNTLGDIAEKVGSDKDRVRYIVESRKIKPVARAGHYRLWDDTAVERVRAAIEAIDAKREATAV